MIIPRNMITEAAVVAAELVTLVVVVVVVVVLVVVVVVVIVVILVVVVVVVVAAVEAAGRPHRTRSITSSHRSTVVAPLRARTFTSAAPPFSATAAANRLS